MTVAVAPRCACGEPMHEMVTPGFFECAHCDGPCHLICKPADCLEGHGKCSDCATLDIGSRKKKDRNWVPPLAA